MTSRSRWYVAGPAMMLMLGALPAAAQQSFAMPAADAVLKETPSPVFSIGKEEGQSWEMFSGLRAVAFDAKDNLYVLDGQNSRVVMFDARGAFVRQFGRKGGGPGELQAPVSLTVASDGSVVVNDVANRAFILFTPAGEYIRNVAYGDGMGISLDRLQADPRGGIVGRANPRPDRDAPDAGDRKSSIYRQPLQGSAAPVTLYEVPIPAPKVIDNGGGRIVSMQMDPAFGASPSFGVLPGGVLALHHETEYSIKLLDGSGRHVRTLTRPFEARKVTRKDQEAFAERRRAARASGSAAMVTMTVGPGGTSTSVGSAARPPAGAMTFDIDKMPFAEYMSIVTGLRTDALGRIWVQRRNEDGTNAGPVDLITSNGRYIGTLPAQDLPSAISANGQLAAYIERDDLEVERVTVRRLPATWR